MFAMARLPGAGSPESLAERVLAQQALLVKYEQNLAQKTQTLRARDQRIDQLLDYIELLRHKRFGASADRVSKDQITLFDESELEQLIGELEVELDVAEIAPVKDKAAPAKKPVRRPLPAVWPRWVVKAVIP